MHANLLLEKSQILVLMELPKEKWMGSIHNSAFSVRVRGTLLLGTPLPLSPWEVPQRTPSSCSGDDVPTELNENNYARNQAVRLMGSCFACLSLFQGLSLTTG